MPWHSDNTCDSVSWRLTSKLRDKIKEFMVSHVCRKTNNIRGFSRETMVALVANIESQEWRREFNAKSGIPRSTQEQVPLMMWNVLSAFYRTTLERISL